VTEDGKKITVTEIITYVDEEDIFEEPIAEEETLEVAPIQEAVP
jgi:hypothetical protein